MTEIDQMKETEVKIQGNVNKILTLIGFFGYFNTEK